MPQTPRWFDITDQLRQVPSPVHDRVVAIMQSLDKRYGALARIGQEPTSNKTRLTEWVNKGADGQKICVIGATYAEEPDGPLRRLFAVLYDSDPVTSKWTNLRIGLLGIDHEYPEHREPDQWNASNFAAWYEDLHRALIGLATSGHLMVLPKHPPALHFKAYVPRSMTWEPMKAFHEFIFRQLERRHGGYLIHPSQVPPAGDWVDYEFMIDCKTTLEKDPLA